MGLIAMIKSMYDRVFRSRAEQEYKIETVQSPSMDSLIAKCANVYSGKPPWLDEEDGIRTINFAKSVCSEVARLSMLATSIKVDGSARADYLQEQVDGMYFKIREWVEFGCAYGTIAVKPNGRGFDRFTPNNFVVTECDDDHITGAVFRDSYTVGDKHYTRLEYHRFEGDGYIISNRAYVSKSSADLGDRIPLEDTRWKDLLDDTPPITKANGEKLDGPMFGIFRTPAANNVDIESPLGMPIYAEALEELRDLDVAYSRNATEIFDSQKIVLIDDQLTKQAGQGKKNSDGTTAQQRVQLPHYVKDVFGISSEVPFYQEIVPALQTPVRLEGLNSQLSLVGYKCGFSQGYFVFDQKTGMVTATQVESDDRRTIQLIKDIRDKLEGCIDDAIYALSIYADLYGLAPAGEYEITYDFGDITYNREEDRARWWSYVVQNKVPAWMYFQKFEGMSEEEAKAMVEEATPKEEPVGMFGGGEE